MNGLLPCPFCGSYERHICQIPTYYKINPHIWYVKCDICEAQGARHFTEAKAIAAWNNRAPIEYAESVSEEGIVQNYCPNCGRKVVK